MAKTILKEILIILLVCVAIVLLMAVIFYNYIPTNKVIPAKVTAYQLPQNVEEIINETTIDSYNSSSINYTIDNADLSKYQATQSYNPGKADPFSAASEETNPSINDNGTGTGTSNEPVDQNVTDNYYTSQNISSGTK